MNRRRDRRCREIGGAFAVALVLTAALCGFAAVDLSTDHYLPGRIGVLLQVNAIDSQGISFTLLGEDRVIPGEISATLSRAAYGLRGFLPGSVRWAELLVSEGVAELEERREAQRELELAEWTGLPDEAQEEPA